MKGALIVSSILFLLLFGGIAQATQFSNKNSANIAGWHFTFYTNIDPRINFYTENGYSLGSELCQGQKFRVSTADPSGEWIVLGEFDGSPPVVWVKNMADFLKTVKMAEQSRSKSYSTIIIESISNTSVDKEVGIPVYYIGAGSWGYSLLANVVCELPKFTNIDVTGGDTISKNTFEVTAADKINISFNTDVNCVYYFIYIFPLRPDLSERIIMVNSLIPNERSTPGKVDIDKILNNMSSLKLGTISDNKLIEITKTPSQPKIEVTSLLTGEQLSYHSSTYLKLTINNTGDKEVDIKDIGLNVNSQFLACTSMKLMPGESTECIFYVSPKDSSLIQANVKYQYTMCGERKTKTENFQAGYIDVKPAECLKNSDCQENYICCAGKCHDPANGICSDVNADGIPEWIGK
jgi:hypothetical protein